VTGYSTFALFEQSLGLLELDPAAGYAVQGFDPGAPAHRESVDANSDANGEYDTTRWWGGRIVTLDLRLVGDPETRHSLRSNLVRYSLPALRPAIRWRSPHYGEVQTLGRFQSVTAVMPLAMRGYTARVVQRCASGLLQSTALRQTVVRPGTAGAQAGRVYDLTFPRVYPTGVVVGSGLAAVAGEAPVSPVVRIYGPVANPDLQIVTTGARWLFSGNGGLTVAAGDYVEIDVAARTVYLNGNSTLTRYNYLDFATLAWAGLAPGNNALYFTGGSPDSNTNALIEWRDSWL
jgi:hypothetical protein